MSNQKKYGWICESWDDEFVGVAFDSIEDAFADAQTTFEENADCLDWAPGRHEVEVDCVELDEVQTFIAEVAIDDVIQRCSDEGMEEADAVLQLHTGARNRLRDELQAAWDRHVEREKVSPWYMATHRVERRTVQFDVGGDE